MNSSFQDALVTAEDLTVFEYRCENSSTLLAWISEQSFCSSRNIGFVTLTIIYFHYLEKSSLDQSINVNTKILKTEALFQTLQAVGLACWLVPIDGG